MGNLEEHRTQAPYERIWLQWYGDVEGEEPDADPPDAFAEGGGVTWCQDQVWSLDTAYIRADLVRPLLEELEGYVWDHDDPELEQVNKLRRVLDMEEHKAEIDHGNADGLEY